MYLSIQELYDGLVGKESVVGRNLVSLKNSISYDYKRKKVLFLHLKVFFNKKMF